jgi:hypothetical protein
VKKADPDLRIDEFIDRAAESLADWKAIDAAIVAAGRGGLRLRRRAATDSFLALAISWEAFLSGWFVAAVNREPRKAIRYLRAALEDHATNELRVPRVILSPTLLTSSHLTRADVAKILDPNGRNFVMADHADFMRKSKKWLYHPYGTRARAVSELEFSVAFVARKVRNLFAHESASASSEAWDIVSDPAAVLPAQLRVGGRTNKFNISGWRGYILESVGGVPRVEFFHQELSALAGRLRR